MSPAVRVLLVLVRGYRRWVSPALGPHCRFAPSCSAFAVEALQVHGAVRGTGLTARRLLRCHPWNPGGHDPVPPGRSRSETMSVPVLSAQPPIPPSDLTRSTQPRSRAGATS
jgi:putative membrane protein insertion efficiency factor